MARYIFVIDVDRCLGCQSCMVSCKLQNGVPLGAYRNMVCSVGPMGQYPDIQMYSLPVMCQHCENPDCVKVCPTEACHVDRTTGLVQIKKQDCIGCKCCIEACPYHLITFHYDQRVADKCNTCLASEQSEMPACAKNCAGSAIYFGDVDDPESPVAKLLKTVDASCIYHFPDTGNKPSTCYLLRKGSWQEENPCNWDGWKGVR